MPGSSDRPRVKHMPSYTKTAGRQVLKSSIGKGMVRSGGRATARVGARSARVLANVLRSGSRMYSVTILRSLMRALMANVITAVVTLGLFTLYDVVIWLRKGAYGPSAPGQFHQQHLGHHLGHHRVLPCGNWLQNPSWETPASWPRSADLSPDSSYRC